MAPAAEDERLGRDPPRVREPLRALIYALAGVPDPGPRGRGRLRVARLLDRVRPPAPRLDDPAGRLGELTEALVRSIVDDDGTVLCDRVVSRLLLEGGRCVGVETEAGETFSAREAVVSTIHVKHLVEMAPADAWGEDFLYGVETYDVGLSGFAVYMAATRPPVFETPAGQRTAVSAGLIGWPQELLDHGRRLRDGVYDPDPAWLLVATPTLADPSRAPEGRHTVKFLSGQGWRLPEGESGWDQLKLRQARRQLERVRRFAPSFDEDAVLEMLVKSPFDIEASNRHMIRGAFHGGDRGLAQMRAPCGRCRAGDSTGCRSTGSTRPAARPIRAARSPAPPGATPPP